MSMSSSRIGAALVAGALLIGGAPGFAQQAQARRPVSRQRVNPPLRRDR